ncbi:MAG: hypothetical protein TREMPRED_004099, partial [Tremellales sp. Tagirdzhanova-0007]
SSSGLHLLKMALAPSSIPPLPPFTLDSALQKVKAAQDKWSPSRLITLITPYLIPASDTTIPRLISPAYTPDSIWRNRDQFFSGTKAIEDFLTRKWEVERNYRLRKELFSFSADKIAVEFWYEYSEEDDPASQWYRTYGIEHWVFAEDGRMKSRQMSGNTVSIKHDDRWFKDGMDVNESEIPRGHISLK